MKIKIFSLVILISVLISVSCGNNDDDGSFELPPPRDRNEQQIVDNDSLIQYFKTHYYNASTFDGGTDFTMEDIVIEELPKDEDGNYLDLPDPDNNRLLFDELNDTDGKLKAVDIMLTLNDEEINYTYYILKINQGGGEGSPTFADDVLVRYEGELQDDTVFDSAVTPVDFDLVGDGGITGFGVIRGWRLVFPQFNSAESFTTNDDGILSFSNFGLGVMFVPSGLGYYEVAQIGIPAYSNLIFKFELLQTQENDHDNDGIPSYLEDLDEDGELFSDDTDENNFPNYLDPDDDGDGVLTINEDANGDGDPTNDFGANGIERYLDPEETESFEDED